MINVVIILLFCWICMMLMSLPVDFILPGELLFFAFVSLIVLLNYLEKSKKREKKQSCSQSKKKTTEASRKDMPEAAKKIFLAYGCSRTHMAQDGDGVLAAYSRFRVTAEQEAAWTEEYIADLFRHLEESGHPSYISDLLDFSAVRNDPARLRRLFGFWAAADKSDVQYEARLIFALIHPIYPFIASSHRELILEFTPELEASLARILASDCDEKIRKAAENYQLRMEAWKKSLTAEAGHSVPQQ